MDSISMVVSLVNVYPTVRCAIAIFYIFMGFYHFGVGRKFGFNILLHMHHIVGPYFGVKKKHGLPVEDDLILLLTHLFHRPQPNYTRSQD